MSHRLRCSAVLGAAVAVFGLSACSSPSSPSPSDSTGPSGGAPSSSITNSSTTSPSTTTVPAGMACAARALAASVVGSQGAAGTFEITFGLHNSSSSSCPMNGFPGAQLLDASGTELPTHVVRGGNYQFTNLVPTPVVLAAGATAYFNLAYSDVPTGSETSCPTAAQIEVTPPNAFDHDVVSVHFAVCNGGTLTVSPVFGPGSPSSQTTAPPQP